MSSKVYVGISISESEDMRALGLGTLHLQDAVVECARHLLQRGYGLAYGGDLTYDVHYNFASLVLQFARTYSGGDGDDILNYSAFPLNTKITEEMQADIVNFATIIPVIPARLEKQWSNVRYESATEDQIRALDRLFAAQDEESKEIWSESLTQMRREMTEKISARIVLGGKTKGFRGKMPGIIEETIYCIQHDVPVLIDGRFGGAAGKLATWLKEGSQLEIPGELDLKGKLKDKVSILDENIIAISGNMSKEKFYDIISWLLI
jgi:hypothetical protein